MSRELFVLLNKQPECANIAELRHLKATSMRNKKLVLIAVWIIQKRFFNSILKFYMLPYVHIVNLCWLRRPPPAAACAASYS